jgi:extracellular factor (EF) 3-hydroxypalmitic acid methyl ester biosynthesis protein
VTVEKGDESTDTKSRGASMSTTTAMKQEFFSIDESKRKKIIRQDRHNVLPGKCFLKTKQDKLELVNISAFGCAIVLTAEQFEILNAQWTNDSLEGSLVYENFELQDIKLKKVRHNHIGSNVTIAFECIAEPIKIDRYFAITQAYEVLENVSKSYTELTQMPADFKQIVFELKELLLKLKTNVDQIESQIQTDSKKISDEFEMTVADVISVYLNQAIPQYYSVLPKIFSTCDEATLNVCKKFAREQIGHLIYGAPFANRAYFKPRGYAGDYEMMNHLYREEPVGKTLFDKCLHKYFVDEPAGEAVKNRGHYLHKKIKEVVDNEKSEIKILSVASGPALEQQLFLKNSDTYRGRKIQFNCIDQDEESLKHAQLQIKSIDRVVQSGFDFNFSNLAIKNIIVHGLSDGNYDLIYTAGLFDYFTEPVATAAALKLFAALKPGGKLIIGNFSKNNPSVPFMELILDWNLIYRSPEDLKRIFSPVTKNIEIEQENLGINLFAVMEKK